MPAEDAAIRSGKRVAGSGAYPGGLVPGYDGARGQVQAYFGFEWQHQGVDYARDAELAERLANRLVALVP